MNHRINSEDERDDFMIRNRDESIELISDRTTKEQLKKAITGGCSNHALSFMAGLKDEYVGKILDGNLSANAVNKLTEACENNKIDYNDFFRISDYAPISKHNEKYLDEFLNSIDKGVYHETAAKVFAAVGYDNSTYKEALNLVRTGVYYPTDYAGLAVAEDAVKELGRMGYPLRACEGFNYCYDIDSADRLSGALERGAAITIPDKSVAVELKKAMYNEDWIDFRNYIIKEMGDNMSDLTGTDFAKLRKGFDHENMSELLYNKVKAEYDKFISDMQKEPVGVVIESAYEIVWKDNITQYLENENPDISQKQYAALMKSNNTLDEIYEEWCSNGVLHSYDDIGTALECTANAISYSLERNQKEQEREQPPVIPEVKSENIPAPTETKRRSR